ncbi:MAG: hypothetical protein A2X80_00865 [Geobacteraceae bacterium GWB2_52_12]|nr:MAG: hypothetical protein A2X80_00865 [Geobacteraceae bacterium GWB2_52_12]
MRNFLPDLRERNLTDKEDMDLPEADVETLHRTIRQFRLINMLFSGSRRLLHTHVFNVMERDRHRHYTMLDVGAGGCDIAVWVAREARRRKISLHITALDNDARILPVAEQAIRSYPEIYFKIGDALNSDNLDIYDFIFSNHFLHHLKWNEIKLFLQHALSHTRVGLVMNDLKRTTWSYLGCSMLLPFFGYKSFICRDGRLSIRRGFTFQEITSLLNSSFNGEPLQVIEIFPSRIAIVTKPPELKL